MKSMITNFSAFTKSRAGQLAGIMLCIGTLLSLTLYVSLLGRTATLSQRSPERGIKKPAHSSGSQKIDWIKLPSRQREIAHVLSEDGEGANVLSVDIDDNVIFSQFASFKPGQHNVWILGQRIERSGPLELSSLLPPTEVPTEARRVTSADRSFKNHIVVTHSLTEDYEQYHRYNLYVFLERNGQVEKVYEHRPDYGPVQVKLTITDINEDGLMDIVEVDYSRGARAYIHTIRPDGRVRDVMDTSQIYAIKGDIMVALDRTIAVRDKEPRPDGAFCVTENYGYEGVPPFGPPKTISNWMITEKTFKWIPSRKKFEPLWITRYVKSPEESKSDRTNGHP